MKHNLHNGQICVINSDCLTYLKTLQDHSINLIITDPPYFRVKKDAWDNQWKSEFDFLTWLEEIFTEYARVLKPSGSIYVFCSDKMAAKTEVLLGKYFNILNHIIWRKENGIHKRHKKENLRRFAGQTERIIFAENFNSENIAKGSSSYFDKCQDLKASVYDPIISYFKEAKEKANISSKAINEVTNSQMCSHWFSSSQWKLPTKEQYEILQKLFSKNPNALNKDHNELSSEFSTLQESYGELTKNYEHLKKQYENLRRKFSVTNKVQYTDVWDFNSVQYYEGKHPCEKPFNLINHIIKASSRKGDLVLDTFLGSGKAITKACLENDCKLVGIEMDEDIFNSTLENLKKCA